MKLSVDIKKKLKNHDLRVSFEIEKETLGFLGASGSGKSMLLKCIAGIETPDSGRIQLGERVLFDKESGINISPQERKIGLSFQQYALFPHMSVYKNVASVTKNKALVSELITIFQLENVKDSYPRQLSGGQKQRVSLARMLASEPELLLFDEPFSALDAPLKEELQLELKKRLSFFDGNVLIVSHSLDELYRLCPQLAIITEKDFIFGQTKQLFRQPKTVAAAKLTGCKNIFPIEKVGKREVRVVGWKETWYVDSPLTEECGYIGIRAHEFSVEIGENKLPVEFIQQQQNPFEQDAWFNHQGQKIWWKGSKQIDASKIQQFTVPPEAIMVLK
ncbi:sulfate/molybdate ABC transporter ATP-binding protein [Enterococcus rivorum]|uniref:Molybdenum ABC transporter ATP-binding protein n=1 Tax=Enterococcus rivorum TaxID=762845 RepID=A0A1E5KV99_9ENTE|nr:ATP-binding cassette domain-containing protein [Enterococcus rivorum]MBP2100361.1 molybdate transport system ATP-binding protein [Enterococcus rivorum]OEH81728.1 molybdenum ABC transporter ATP-binding protein [Enterococcus rivorum]